MPIFISQQNGFSDKNELVEAFNVIGRTGATLAHYTGKPIKTMDLRLFKI